MLGSENWNHIWGEKTAINERHTGKKEIRRIINDKQEGEEDWAIKRRENKNVYGEGVEKCGTRLTTAIVEIETKWEKDAVHREKEEVWGS